MAKIFLLLTVIAFTSATFSPNDNHQRTKRNYYVYPHGQQVHYLPVYPVSPSRPGGQPGHQNVQNSGQRVACGMPAVKCTGKCHSKNVGGIPALQNEFPWLVRIVSQGRHICSGSLVDNQYVLTAARCLDPANPASVAALRLHVGDFDKTKAHHGGHMERNATTVYIHSRYQKPGSRQVPMHDIAMIKLSAPVPFSMNIRPVCLDDGSARVDNGFVDGVLAGWGALSYSNRKETNVPHKVTARISTFQECRNTYAQYGYKLEDDQICAGLPANPCVGDDGGPLVVKIGDNTWQQVGISSFGMQCGGPTPVYTKVSFYRSWIEQVRAGKMVKK